MLYKMDMNYFKQEGKSNHSITVDVFNLSHGGDRKWKVPSVNFDSLSFSAYPHSKRGHIRFNTKKQNN